MSTPVSNNLRQGVMQLKCGCPYASPSVDRGYVDYEVSVVDQMSSSDRAPYVCMITLAQ